MSSEEEKVNLKCPYCDVDLFDDEGICIEDACKHLYSIQDDFVDWGDDYKNIYELGNILEDYGGVFEEDEYIEEFNKFTEGLKIDKYIKIKSDWNIFSIEEKVNDITDDIIILNESWDGGYPGGSGTMRYLFIKDWDKVSWIFDDLKIVSERALILVEKVENSE